MDGPGAQVCAVRSISIGDRGLRVFVLLKGGLLLRLSGGCLRSLLLLHSVVSFAVIVYFKAVIYYLAISKRR